jgi:MFS-type transporter involved in bile tolerance (Atg22 family)
MYNFFKGRKLSLFGIVIVVIVAFFAPYINPNIGHKQTMLMVIMFVLFVIFLDIIYKRGDKK